MSSATTPVTRGSTDLKPTSKAADKFAPLKDYSEDAVFSWAEGIRDNYERKGKLMTVKGLINTARLLGPEGMDAVKVIKHLYAEEYAAEKAAAEAEGGTTPAAPKKEGKKPMSKTNGNGNGGTKSVTKVTKNGKTAVAVKSNGKKVVVKKGNGKGNPDKKPNGKKVASKPVRTATVRTKQAIRNKTQIPVEVTRSEGGKARVLIDGIPMRGWLRWAGKDNWEVEEATYALKKMGLSEEAKVVGPTMSLASVIRDHMGSGSHGDDGWHGFVPQPTKDQMRTFRALKPSKAAK